MTSQGHRIVFLYSELAGYFLGSAKVLGEHPDVASVNIVHWPTNPEAPFTFESTDQYALHAKSDYTRDELHQLIESINPTAIVCSGWMDADYNAVAKHWQPKIPVVLTFDNWWKGSLKQWLAVWTSAIFIHRRFNKAWIPGKPQQLFAEKLGFRTDDLATGFYCADRKPFEQVFDARKARKPSKKLLYVGRYLDFKGIRELWSAFAEVSHEFPEWELHCIGTGQLWKDRAVHPKIFHHGFKQPYELSPFLEETAVFVMPSKIEPWGVVLHEMAIAGIPLLASTKVGAATAFLNPGKNGAVFELKDLSDVLRSFMTKTEEERIVMGRESHDLSTNNTPRQWCNELLHIL